MSMSSTQPLVNRPDKKVIAPSNPAGTFGPSYRIKASETNREAQSISLPAAQPMIRSNPDAEAQHQRLLSQTALSPETTGTQLGVRMPHEQLYFQASFPPQAVITPPRTATISPHPSDIQTDRATTYYRAAGVSELSRSPTMPGRPLPIDNQQDLQFQRTARPQVIATQQRVSKTPSGYLGAPEPYDDAARPLPIDNQQQDLQLQRAARPQAITTQQRVSKTPSGYLGAPEPYDDAPYDPRSLNSQQSYLTPQSEATSKSTPSPYMDEQVPALTTQPKFDWKGNACIVSHDPLLNNNGDALYRFILDHMDLPSVQLHCFGSHVVALGTAETERTTVVDFDFVIDLALSMKPGPAKLYTYGDDVMAYRGEMFKEVGVMRGPDSLSRLSGIGRIVTPHLPRLGKSLDSIRLFPGSICRKYAMVRLWKSGFTSTHNSISIAVRQIIRSTGYSSSRKVYFTVGNTSIKVQADSTLMMILTDGLIKYLPWIYLVYPFAWIYRLWGEGGKWDVCRASFTCNRDPRDPPEVIGIPLGEGDWVKIWERTIRLGIRNRIQTTRPICRPTANDSDVIVFD